MISVDTLLADPLVAVRKAAHPIGFVGLDIPLEVLSAGGRSACHLPWDRTAPTPRADKWLESGFAPWARLILEDWAEGRFDLFEAVVFTRGDDSAQRLYYYICELQRRGEIKGPTPLIFDVSYIRRPTSTDRTRAAVAHLCVQLGVSPADLDVTRINSRREMMSGWQVERQSDGAAYERLTRASLFADANFTPPAARAVSHRFLLAGTPPPDDRLHRAVDEAGAAIVTEAHNRSLNWMGPAVAESTDPVTAIAASLSSRLSGSRAFYDRSAHLVEAVRKARADAVLLWLIEEEESDVWHVPAQRDALAKAGIPALILTRRNWHDDIRAELTHFLSERSA